ncbi:MAG: hypothetical protein RL653_633 [Pseudomonadota bacterium]
MRRWLLPLLAAVACSHGPAVLPEDPDDAGTVDPAADAGTAPGCRGFSAPRRVGNNPAELPELSGLAASRKHPGIYWAHNDSGNALELLAISEDGALRARIPLTGARNVDVEDVAVAPCGESTCVVLADVGDNQERRTGVALYRLLEPDVLDDAPRAVEVLPFRYEDRPHNVESFVADPVDGTAWLVTKGLFTLGDVYRVDGLGAPDGGTAVKVAALANPGLDQLSTAADAHPEGHSVLVRSYGRAWLYRAPDGGSLAGAWGASPVEVPAPSQPQSEAVSWLPDGRGYLVGTEGAGEGLFRVDCVP